jgi:Xaa-Pro aminopeptidase
MEVLDGNNWTKIHPSNANIGLNSDAESAIEWVIKRQKQEKDWYELASSNEAVRIALEQLEQAQTRLELIATLAREHEQNAS